MNQPYRVADPFPQPSEPEPMQDKNRLLECISIIEGADDPYLVALVLEAWFKGYDS